MLDLVHIFNRDGRIIFPGSFPPNLNILLSMDADGRDALGAHNMVAGLIEAADNLALAHESADAIGKFVIDFHVIVNISLVIRSLTPSDGHRFERVSIFE